jgi:hypothetical protein
MTIGRTDDPENPLVTQACEVAVVFGAGSRIPSGPADMEPRQQAGHMIAIDLPVRLLTFLLASEGPSTHVTRGHFAQLAPKTPVAGHVAIAQTFATNLCDRENGGIW